MNGLVIGNYAIPCLQLSQFRSFIAEELKDSEGSGFFPPNVLKIKAMGGHEVTWKVAV